MQNLNTYKEFNIQDIKNIPITEICSNYGITTHKKGKKLYCNIRDEKTPSCCIYPETNSWYDFGSNLGGDVISLIATLENITSGEAIQKLGEMFNISYADGSNQQSKIFPTENQFSKIGLNYKRAIANMDLNLNTLNIDFVKRLESKYSINLRELSKLEPDTYHKLIDKKSLPIIYKQRNLLLDLKPKYLNETSEVDKLMYKNMIIDGCNNLNSLIDIYNKARIDDINLNELKLDFKKNFETSKSDHFNKLINAHFDIKSASTDEILDTLKNGVGNIFNNENFKKYLEYQSNFSSYSINNNLLISIQNPNATNVATARKWNSLGRYINKGEKAIYILQPQVVNIGAKKIIERLEKYNTLNIGKFVFSKTSPDTYIIASQNKILKKDISKNEFEKFLTMNNIKGQLIVGFKKCPVFDVSQTNGKEIPQFKLHDLNDRDLINATGLYKMPYIKIKSAESDLFKEGEILSLPKANELFAKYEKEIREKKSEYNKKNEYFPYSKVRFTIHFSPDIVIGSRYDVGDGYANDLIDFIQKDFIAPDTIYGSIEDDFITIRNRMNLFAKILGISTVEPNEQFLNLLEKNTLENQIRNLENIDLNSSEVYVAISKNENTISICTRDTLQKFNDNYEIIKVADCNNNSINFTDDLEKKLDSLKDNIQVINSQKLILESLYKDFNHIKSDIESKLNDYHNTYSSDPNYSNKTTFYIDNDTNNIYHLTPFNNGTLNINDDNIIKLGEFSSPFNELQVNSTLKITKQIAKYESLIESSLVSPIMKLALEHNYENITEFITTEKNNFIELNKEKPDITNIKTSFEMSTINGEIFHKTPFNKDEYNEWKNKNNPITLVDNCQIPTTSEIKSLLDKKIAQLTNSIKIEPTFDSNMGTILAIKSELENKISEKNINLEYTPDTHGAKGYYAPLENKICVDPNLSLSQQTKTLIHEYVHSQLHSDLNIDNSKDTLTNRETREIEAEGTAYVVAKHFGFDTSEYSFDYISSWANGKDISNLNDTLNSIHSASNSLINELEAPIQLNLFNNEHTIKDILSSNNIKSNDILIRNMLKINKLTGKINTISDLKNAQKFDIYKKHNNPNLNKLITSTNELIKNNTIKKEKNINHGLELEIK